MKCIEIIEIQSIGQKRAALDEYLMKMMNDSGLKDEIYVYSNVLYNNDISLHLVNNSLKTDVNSSTLGRYLATRLKDFGLVNYSIWQSKIIKKSSAKI